MPLHFDIYELIQAAGYLGVFGIVFAESGLFFGFFLPGDSLLFTAGLLASQGFFSLPVLAVGCVIAAIAGDAVGYWCGCRFGRRFFLASSCPWLKPEYLQHAEAFYDRHGGKAVVIARFLPIVRTFVPIAAGIAGMKYRRFALFNMLGALIWGGGVTLAGYGIGSVIPHADRYLLPIVVFIVAISVAPSLLHVLRSSHKKTDSRPEAASSWIPRRTIPAVAETEAEG